MKNFLAVFPNMDWPHKPQGELVRHIAFHALPLALLIYQSDQASRWLHSSQSPQEGHEQSVFGSPSLRDSTASPE